MIKETLDRLKRVLLLCQTGGLVAFTAMISHARLFAEIGPRRGVFLSFQFRRCPSSMSNKNTRTCWLECPSRYSDRLDRRGACPPSTKSAAAHPRHNVSQQRSWYLREFVRRFCRVKVPLNLFAYSLFWEPLSELCRGRRSAEMPTFSRARPCTQCGLSSSPLPVFDENVRDIVG